MGHLLQATDFDTMGFEAASEKLFYKASVKTLNKTLNARVGTLWYIKHGLNDDVKPAWRALYKAPLAKQYGDLDMENQWNGMENQTLFLLEIQLLLSFLCRERNGLSLLECVCKCFTKYCFILGVM